jgi:dTDP-4-dehydrorhamnose reductase
VRELSIMRIVVTGATGQLGHYLVEQLLASGGHTVIPWGRSPGPERWGLPVARIELTDAASVAFALDQSDPDVIIHAAAISAAEAVRREPEAARAVNVEATRTLTTWCGRRGRRLVFTSTDLVFDGTRSWYREDDSPAPILEYGRTKAAAEDLVRGLPDGLIARLSLLYGPSRSRTMSFYDRAMSELRAGRPQAFFEDEFRTPLDYASAARILIRLAVAPARGVVHVGGRERISRYDLMRRAAVTVGLDASVVTANRQADVVLAEPRPADVSLDTSRLESLLPDLERPPIETAIRT